jgi:hypothetical protein
MDDQLADLKKKIEPIQQIIISLRPRERPPLIADLPYFGDSSEHGNNDGSAVGELIDESEKIENTFGSWSENLYKEFDGEVTGNPTMSMCVHH